MPAKRGNHNMELSLIRVNKKGSSSSRSVSRTLDLLRVKPVRADPRKSGTHFASFENGLLDSDLTDTYSLKFAV
jgi:hypothetical protein